MVTLLDWTPYLSGTCKGLYLRMDTKLCKMRFDFGQTVLTITGSIVNTRGEGLCDSFKEGMFT